MLPAAAARTASRGCRSRSLVPLFPLHQGCDNVNSILSASPLSLIASYYHPPNSCLSQGFDNVNNILSGAAYAPGLLIQIVVMKVIATSICRGSGLQVRGRAWGLAGGSCRFAALLLLGLWQGAITPTDQTHSNSIPCLSAHPPTPQTGRPLRPLHLHRRRPGDRLRRGGTHSGRPRWPRAGGAAGICARGCVLACGTADALAARFVRLPCCVAHSLRLLLPHALSILPSLSAPSFPRHPTPPQQAWPPCSPPTAPSPSPRCSCSLS